MAIGRFRVDEIGDYQKHTRRLQLGRENHADSRPDAMKRSTRAALRKVWRNIYFGLLSAWTVLVAVAATNELFGGLFGLRPLGYYGLWP